MLSNHEHFSWSVIWTICMSFKRFSLRRIIHVSKCGHIMGGGGVGCIPWFSQLLTLTLYRHPSANYCHHAFLSLSIISLLCGSFYRWESTANTVSYEHYIFKSIGSMETSLTIDSWKSDLAPDEEDFSQKNLPSYLQVFVSFRSHIRSSPDSLWKACFKLTYRSEKS